MNKQLRFLAILISLLALATLILSSCDKEKPAETKQETKAETNETTKEETKEDITSEPTVPIDPVKEPTLIKKVTAAAAEAGIYTFAVTLDPSVAAEKGSVEFIYYGPTGSSTEDVIVATFHADYYKEESGTYDIMDYLDGMINQHHAHQADLKMFLTFGALVRAGKVVVYYAPQGEDLREIYTAYASDYMK